MAFKIDMSKMKKVAEDKHSATLRHEKGHEMKIAKAHLSEEMRKQLELLPIHKAEGGYANSSNQQAAMKENHQGTDWPYCPKCQKSHPNCKCAQNFASGGEAQMQQEDSGDSAPVDSAPAQAPATVNINVGQPAPQQMGNYGVIPGQEAQAAANMNKAIDDKASSFQNDLRAQHGVAPLPAAEAPTLKPDQQQQSADVPAPSQAQASVPAPVQDMDQSSPAQASGSPDQAQSAPSAAEQPMAQPQAPAQAQTQDVSAELQQQNDHWAQDLVNQHITPKTYHDLYAQKSTLGKIGMIFGMLISGMGSGLTHQPNALLEMMNKTLEQDLDAQKQSKTNAYNFLKMNQENELHKAQARLADAQVPLQSALYKQTMIDAQTKAYALTQAQMLQTSYHNLVQQMQKMPEGPQKEAAKQTLGMIYPKIADKINNINDQAAGATAYNNILFGNGPGTANPQGASSSDEQAFQNKTNGMRMLGTQGEMRAKDIESKHVPGFEGQASHELSGSDRQDLQTHSLFDQKVRQFYNWAQQHNGSLDPRTVAEGQALAADVQNAYRATTNGGVFRPGEQSFIEKSIDPDPTKFFNNLRVLPKLKGVIDSNQATTDALAKSHGFNGYKPQQAAPQQSGPADGATGTYNGKPVIRKNGKWMYQ